MLNPRLKHGGHVVDPHAKGQPEPTATKMGYPIGEYPSRSSFDYLLQGLKTQPDAHIPGEHTTVTGALMALGAAMTEPGGPPPTPDPDNSRIPAIYTYWGQFVDHDMTANTDRDSAVSDITKSPIAPLGTDRVAKELENLRRPTFDLDSVYGNGPGLSATYDKPDPGGADRLLYDGIRMRLGQNSPAPGVRIPPTNDLTRDLPRFGLLPADMPLPATVTEDGPPPPTGAVIGDARNDENLIIAQLHLAFLRFHNRVVDAIEANPAAFGLLPVASDGRKFDAAQQLVRFHYQWICIHDYLKTVCLPEIVDEILLDGPAHYERLPDGSIYAPLEYSVAAFRFGHSMIRGGYDLNRNFGVPGFNRPFASLADLFEFTGNGFVVEADGTRTPRPLGGAPTLPFNWVVEWDRMTRKDDPNPGHFARKIDTRLAPTLLDLPKEGTGGQTAVVAALLRQLAQRNLLRGYLLSLPTGQAAAAAMGVEPMREEDLRRDVTPEMQKALEDGGFLTHTPLWFYILKEAETYAGGNSLGELGSRIVAETQIGIMLADERSYLYRDWDPAKSPLRLTNGDPIRTIRDFFAFAGLAA
jgi:hypothetical protein